MGKKLYITGKGRCNLTNACESDIFLENVITNPRFLFPAIKSFGTNDTIQFFESIGLKTKIERGRRVFPQSDHASDVILALQNELKRQKVSIRLSSKVEKILCADQSVKGILLENHTKLSADACILATGGLSYPSTGSTGDGYYIAKQLGHTITNLYPSLVGIYVKEAWIAQLEGLSLKNVGLKVVVEEVYETTKGTKQKRLIPNKVIWFTFLSEEIILRSIITLIIFCGKRLSRAFLKCLFFSCSKSRRIRKFNCSKVRAGFKSK